MYPMFASAGVENWARIIPMSILSNGVSALGLQKTLGLGSYHTAWELATHTTSRHGKAQS